MPSPPPTDPFAPALTYREEGAFITARDWLLGWLDTPAAQTAPAVQQATAYAHLTQLQLLIRQPTAAQIALTSAQALAPQLPVVLRNQARLLLQTSQPAAALRAAEAAHTQSPQDPECKLVWATALAATGQCRRWLY